MCFQVKKQQKSNKAIVTIYSAQHGAAPAESV